MQLPYDGEAKESALGPGQTGSKTLPGKLSEAAFCSTDCTRYLSLGAHVSCPWFSITTTARTGGRRGRGARRQPSRARAAAAALAALPSGCLPGPPRSPLPRRGRQEAVPRLRARLAGADRCCPPPPGPPPGTGFKSEVGARQRRSPPPPATATGTRSRPPWSRLSAPPGSWWTATTSTST